MLKSLLVLCLFGLAYCELTATIELSATEYAAGDELLVYWNLSSDKLVGERLLSWNSPMEGEWNSNLFTIVNGEHRAEYQGRLMKRALPTIDNFHHVTSVEGSLSLTEGYKFTKEGDYSITLSFYAHLLNGDSVLVESNTVTLTVTSRDIVKRELSIGHSRAVGYTGCSNSEQSITETAIENAITASANAVTFLDQGINKCNVTAFETWFGNYTSSHWNTIESDFEAINSRLSTYGFNIDCTCNQPGTYAFVYPNDPTHTIHLCPVFWQASTNKYSYNSQPGTLTHEMSHFSDVAGTDDIQYGVPGCIQLANDHPDQAVRNADSHEFLQESDPKPNCN